MIRHNLIWRLALKNQGRDDHIFLMQFVSGDVYTGPGLLKTFFVFAIFESKMFLITGNIFAHASSPSTAVRRTTALHYSDRVIYYIKFDNCHGYLMTGVCQEFCIQRIQTARWRDIADAQSFLVMQLRRETGIWG